MESSGVPVVFETCETLVLLEGYSGVGPLDLSQKRAIEMGWKQDDKWDGGGCSVTCRAREKIQYKYAICTKSLVEIHLDFDSRSWLQIFGGGHGFL